MIRAGLKINHIPLIRCIHTSRPSHSFIGDWFGRKDAQKREKKDLVQDQDDFEIDPSAKIVILNEKNSNEHEKFDVATHMPDFKIEQWKHRVVTPKTIESSYTSKDIIDIINDTLKQFNKESQQASEFQNFKLDDLTFRFEFTKELQKRLGFEINDLILTQAHDLSILFNEVNAFVQKRFTNERNPGDIALRKEDFTAENIYLNQQLSESEQSRELKKLINQARKAL